MTPAISVACDRALRELAPAALEAAGLAARAARLRAMPPVTPRSGSYCADVVHAAFAECRKLMHGAANDPPRARMLGYAGAVCHAAADACAALGASRLGGVHFLHGAKINADEAERIFAESVVGLD